MVKPEKVKIMKQRQGFVSNSSSSSFILALGKPYDKTDMERIMFGGAKSVQSQSLDNAQLFVEPLMDWINSEFTGDNAKITTFNQVCETYSVGWNEGPNLDDAKYNSEGDFKHRWDLYNADVASYKEKRCRELWPEYKQAAKEGRLYTIGFSDNDGAIGCELEHYTPWTSIFKGIRFSHH